MDAEILAAVSGGLGAWAFDRYLPNNTLSRGLGLYQSSSIKSQMPWCSIIEPYMFGSTGNYATEIATLVSEFQQPHHLKIGNRPVIYIYLPMLLTNWGGDNAAGRANFRTALDALRTATVNAGLGQPIIVVMMGQARDMTYYNAYAADAMTSYSVGMSEDLDCPFSVLAARAKQYWADWAALGAKVVPLVMTGWDRRPIIERPFSYDPSQIPFDGMRQYVVYPTNEELRQHFADAVAYVNNNPTICPFPLVHAYAWNEFSEGGILAPTRGDPTGSKLAAIRDTIRRA
ncbi:hypothetical protein [Methylorubrum sp. B1-46]|uniref:hypothetical protein n=1 Tax=Methylorubrum sp. B1-46 TaxID=2897334 RepID=UPI001E479BE9|nr:hypothetical protein [Methylorubrum sp. B1-46]